MSNKSWWEGLTIDDVTAFALILILVKRTFNQFYGKGQGYRAALMILSTSQPKHSPWRY